MLIGNKVVLCPPFFDPNLVRRDLNRDDFGGTIVNPVGDVKQHYIDDYRWSASLLLEAMFKIMDDTCALLCLAIQDSGLC